MKSPYSDVEIPEVNLADFVWRDVHKWPEAIALVSEMNLAVMETIPALKAVQRFLRVRLNRGKHEM